MLKLRFLAISYLKRKWYEKKTKPFAISVEIIPTTVIFHDLSKYEVKTIKLYPPSIGNAKGDKFPEKTKENIPPITAMIIPCFQPNETVESTIPSVRISISIGMLGRNFL